MISAPDNPQPKNTSRIKLRCGGALQTTAFVILLLCVVARPFLMELPFRVSMLYGINLAADLTETALSVDRSELSRVIFASLLVLATAIWLLGGSLAGRAKIRHGWLGVGVLVFALGTLFLVSSASNKRDALTVWAEQAALLSAAFLAVQIFADKRRFAILVIVLAALAGAMAIKGVWQITFEAPQRIADFELHRAERLAEMGWAEGTPQAKLVESRMRDWAPFGFFNLANMFASLLIVISAGACALGAQKLIAALRESISRKTRKAPGRKGEIPLPVLAAILTAIMAVAAVAILILTRSRGAIGSAVLAAIGCCVTLVFAKRLGRHWKKCVLVGCILFVLAASAVVGHGLANDSLPTKTMTFRWYYWTASAEMIADHPLYGVGPGNFAQNYLQYRRPAAEEEIKAPHNLFVHAAAQYGLPLGTLFVLILAYVLIGATRPRTDQADEDEPPVAKPWRSWLLGAVLVAGVFVARWQLANLHDPLLLIFEGLLPAIAFAVCLMVAWWAMPALLGSSSLVRVILTAGLFGLVLHNMVSFSLWAPGVATLFWVTAGACLAQAGPAKPRMFNRVGGARIQVGFIVLTLLVVVLALKPIVARQPYVGRMLAEIRKGDLAGAAWEAKLIGHEADPFDPISSADAAKLYRASARQAANESDKLKRLQKAYFSIEQAVRVDPNNSAWRKLAASTAAELVKMWAKPAGLHWPLTMRDALIHMAAAVELNPSDARLRLQYARMLLDDGRADECVKQLDAAERLESQLTLGSVEQFNQAERARIADLRRQATAN